jgi:hypothetical protein
MQSATMDWCAVRLAAAIEQVAMALAEPEPIVPVRRGADARLTPPHPTAPPSAPKMISTLKK